MKFAKFLALLMGLLMLCSVTMVFAGAESTSDGDLPDWVLEEWADAIERMTPEEYAEFTSPEYQEWLQGIEARYEAAKSGPQLMRDDRNHTISVTMYQQETRTWCGPASVKMALSAFGKTATQSTIATSVVASNGSADAQAMANYLKNNTGKEYRRYWVTPNQNNFSQVLWYSIRYGNPALIGVPQNALPNNNSSNTGGHVVLIRGFYNEGYEGMGGGYYYIDPHWDNAYYGSWSCSASTMFNASWAGSGNYIVLV